MFSGLILSSESFKGTNGAPLNEIDVIRIITSKHAKAISFDALKMLQTRRKNPIFGQVQAEEGSPVELDALLRVLSPRVQKILLSHLSEFSVPNTLARAA